jgi:hypothetical protein
MISVSLFLHIAFVTTFDVEVIDFCKSSDRLFYCKVQSEFAEKFSNCLVPQLHDIYITNV